MKKITFLLFMAALFAIGAKAEVKSPYSVDFNTTISTSSNDFKVAEGWGHITSGYFDEDDWETYYPTYTYQSTAGVDGTGCLKVGSQTSVGSGSSYYSGSTTDLLVTPKITGTATIKVKQVYSTGTVKFYTVSKSGTTYTTGSQISVTLPTLSTDEYVTVTIPDQEGAYVGIYGSNVYLDDFYAASAEIEQTRALTIVSVTSNSGTSADCDADGNYTINYTVKLCNTGDVALAVGDADYKLSLINYSTKDTLDAIAITQPLAVGDTIDENLSVTLNYANYPKRNRYDVYEWVSFTSTYGTWIQPVAYAPDIAVKNSDNWNMTTANGNSYATAFGAFGMIGEDVQKTFSVVNSGAAPFEGTFVVPDGFSLDNTTVSVAAHGTQTFTLTALSSNVGIFSGDLQLMSADTVSWYVTLSSTVRDLNKFFEDFEGNKGVNIMPAGWWDVDNDWDKTTYTSSSMDNYANATLLVEHLLVTPLLKVTEGEKMTFDASKRSVSSFINVYYSADRKNWTLVKEVANSELGTAGSSSKNPTYNTIVVEGIPAGNYYIGFSSGYASIDNVYGFEAVPVDKDIVINDDNIPTGGTVNSEYTASAELLNLLEDSVMPADYTLEFVFNGEVVATATSEGISARGTVDLDMAFTPHEAGTFPAYIKLTVGDNVATTDTINVIIANESATEDHTVGSITSAAGTAPIATNYKNSVYEALYTAEQLAEAGLKAGDKILSLSYYGYFTAADEWTIENANFYVLQNEDSVFGDYSSLTDNDKMTNVFSGTLPTIYKGGSDGNYVKLLTVTLSQPIIYEGKAIRIKSSAAQSSFKSIYFAYDSSLSGQCYGNRSDNTAVGAFSSFYSTNFPVTTFGIELTPDTLKGRVIDTEGNPLEGVSITLNGQETKDEGTSEGIAPMKAPKRAAQVQYTGTTDADGYYKIVIIKADLTYDALYEKEEYQSKTVTYSTFGEVADVVLEKEKAYVITATERPSLDPTTGTEMTKDDETGYWVASGVNVPGVKDGNGYFAITTQLGEQISDIADKMLGFESNGYEVTNFVGNSFDKATGVPVTAGVSNAAKVTGGVYDIYLYTATADAAPKRINLLAEDGGYLVKIVAADETGVNDLTKVSTIANVKYYNMAGVESDQPFDGVNIRVITFTDGTKATTKVLR